MDPRFLRGLSARALPKKVCLVLVAPYPFFRFLVLLFNSLRFAPHRRLRLPYPPLTYLKYTHFSVNTFLTEINYLPLLDLRTSFLICPRAPPQMPRRIGLTRQTSVLSSRSRIRKWESKLGLNAYTKVLIASHDIYKRLRRYPKGSFSPEGLFRRSVCKSLSWAWVLVKHLIFPSKGIKSLSRGRRLEKLLVLDLRT